VSSHSRTVEPKKQYIHSKRREIQTQQSVTSRIWILNGNLNSGYVNLDMRASWWRRYWSADLLMCVELPVPCTCFVSYSAIVRELNIRECLFIYLLNYFLFYFLTYTMEQSPSWEANRFLSSQEIPRILWNPNIYYRVCKFPPPDPILSPFPFLRSYPRISPVPIHMYPFRNRANF